MDFSTHRSAAEIRQRLLDGDLRLLSAGRDDLREFAEQVLSASDRIVQPISDW